MMPTMRLRWCQVDYSDGNIFEPCGFAQQPYKGGLMTAKWRLQQCFVDESGAEEWRNVEFDGEAPEPPSNFLDQLFGGHTK